MIPRMGKSVETESRLAVAWVLREKEMTVNGSGVLFGGDEMFLVVMVAQVCESINTKNYWIVHFFLKRWILWHVDISV